MLWSSFHEQLFLYWSPVGQKNGKYSDHLSELPYENKCSVPSGNVRMLWLKFYSYLTKAWRQSLTLVKEVFYTGHLFVSKMGNIVTTWVNFLMKTNALWPLENFRMLSLKFYSYLTKTWRQRLLLVQEVFLYWSSVGQKKKLYFYTGHLLVRKMGNIVTTWVNFLMKTNAQCPLEMLECSG